MMMVTIIGRGHSGTRIMSHTLTASGVCMGAPLNGSGDLLPAQPMYEACRIMAPFVKWKGGLEWDFSALHDMPIPESFMERIRTYLVSVTDSEAEWKGWKIPETTLVYPWIVRLFPEAKYIFWIRNPRDCVIGAHLTDELRDFGIPYPETEDHRRKRAISWKYQFDLVRATPRPRHWIEIRFEDFVLRREKTRARLETFLGIPLAGIPVRPDAVARWKGDPEQNYFDFFEPAMRRHRYRLPAKAGSGKGDTPC